MTVVNGYCSVDDIRDHLGDRASTFDTGLVERAVNAASRAVDGYTGHRFWQDPAPIARRYRPRRRDRLDVDDISTTTGLIVESSDTPTWTAPALWNLDTDFELLPDNADMDGPAYAWWRLFAVGSKGFPRARFRSVRITARWGWSQIPDPVAEATLLKAVSLFERRNAPFGVAGFGEFGVVKITRKDTDVVDLLSDYTKVLAA